MTIGEKIRYYREMLDITQDEIAVALETTPQNIYKYEKGIITNIPLSSINALAELFEISVKEFVGWGDDSFVFSDDEPNLKRKTASLGANIKRRRLELGLDEIAFAEKIGLVLEKIADFESGHFNNIETELLDYISDALEISVADLMAYTETSDDFELTEDEKELILAYRKHAEHHFIIHRMLGLSPAESDTANTKNFRYPTLSSDDIANMTPKVKIASRRRKYNPAPGEDEYED